MATYKNSYINENEYSRPRTKLAALKGIVLHYTANPGASATNHKTYFGNGAGGRYAGAHIFVDEKEALCIVPLDEICYHANENKCKIDKLKGHIGSYYGDANCTTIGIEMCINKAGKIEESTFNRTVDIVAELCKKYKLTVDDLCRHYDVTGKNCPAPWVSNPAEWTRFKNAVKAKSNPIIKVSSIVEAPSYYKSGTGLYRIKKNCYAYKGVNFSDESNRMELCQKGTKYTIVGIVKYSSSYRLKTKSGLYITANKEYVEKV
ncbi:N-acetylmuramoyl-L-alanine amidase [Rummeliibacillus pycnus]|uniref:N-acetylmuramoyl-L-alanine amidase n=1 Tax=Rummeliibacillus pycnus TaxID=101070 RepID=UPI0037C9E5F0